MSKFIGINTKDSLKILLKGFFTKKDVKERFSFISKEEIFGCEKWIQIELLKYLYAEKSVLNYEIIKEEKYTTDGRTNDEIATHRSDFHPGGISRVCRD